MICWQPYTSVYTGSTFFKNSFIKILISLQPCPISYNLSQSALRWLKYSSGFFSISIPHSDLLASVSTPNRTCSLSIGLIEQGIVSNRQSNSPITSSFIYLFKITSISLLITKYSLFLEFCIVVFWFMQLEKLKWLIQYQTFINDLCQVLGWMNLFIYSFIYLNIKQFGFSLFTEIIMSTECNDKNKKLFFELVLRLI